VASTEGIIIQTAKAIDHTKGQDFGCKERERTPKTTTTGVRSMLMLICFTQQKKKKKILNFFFLIKIKKTLT